MLAQLLSGESSWLPDDQMPYRERGVPSQRASDSTQRFLHLLELELGIGCLSFVERVFLWLTLGRQLFLTCGPWASWQGTPCRLAVKEL